MKIHSTQSPQQKSPRIFIPVFVLLLLGCLGLLFFQSRGRRPQAPQSVTLPSPLYILQNEDGGLVGAVGCQAYDPAEGESPAAIYASVRMGSVYRFAVDTAAQPFCQTDTGSTLLTQVLYQDGADAPQQQN